MATNVGKFMEALKRNPAFISDVKKWMVLNPTCVEQFTEKYQERQRFTEGTASPLGIGVQQGNVDTESPELAATLEIFTSVLRGYTRFMDDSFVKKYQTDKAELKIPLTEYAENVGALDNGVPPNTDKVITYCDFVLNKEFGGAVSWTRSGMEDSTFDLMAEEAEGLGFSMAAYVMGLIVTELDAVTAGNTASGSNITFGAVNADNSIAWSEFLAIIGSVEVGQSGKHYGPCDTVIVSPKIFWQLLNILQLTNMLYTGDTDPVASGIMTTRLGCKIYKNSFIGDSEIYALNSKKAVALAIRRAPKVEPILFPLYNKYGMLLTMRATAKVLHPKAIARGVWSEA